MGWIYLAESEGSVLPSENGLDPSPTAKSTHIVKESCCPECKLMISRLPPYGTILKHSESPTLKHYGDMSISYMEASHAKILALRDMEKVWQESEADFFSKSCAWPKKSSPNSYSLKTFQLLQPEGDFRSLEKLPKWGMIVDGVLYPLHPLERYTVENDGSYWPTPQARAQQDTPSERKRHSPCLHSAILMATPTASQANKPIRMPSPSRASGEHGEDLQDSIGRLNPESIGKRLCPKWVSVLMGYPTTWTDLEASVMPWYLNKRKKRSKS